MQNTHAYDILQIKTDALKARFLGVSFGYIGNVGVDRNGPYDERSWYVFLPHPGRVGTYEDSVGGYRTTDLGRMLADWDHIEQTVADRMARRQFSAQEQLDLLAQSLTCSVSFQALLNEQGNYRPTIRLSRPHAERLADAYDAAQAARGDDRRAYRRP